MRDESFASQSLWSVDEEEDEEQDSFLDLQDNFLAPEAVSLNLSKISAVEDPLSDSLSVMETSLAKDDKSTAKVLTKRSKKAAIVATVADIHPVLRLAARRVTKGYDLKTWFRLPTMPLRLCGTRFTC